MMVKRLGPGDEAILGRLAADDADFDLAGRGAPLQPLDAEAAGRYLSNPAVLHWVAAEGDTLAGELHCIVLPMSTGDEYELLLYEIGVRSSWRRRGVGRALLAAMETWMRDNGVKQVWLGADNPGAVEFYRSCGFAPDDPPAIFMSRRLDATSGGSSSAAEA